MILVDSSVWVDFFNGVETAEVNYLNEILGKEPVATGDLMLAEVLQGFRLDRDVKIAKELFSTLRIFNIAGEEIAVKSAANYRKLRLKGITVRKTIDCLIATFCIEQDFSLLQADKDFEAFHDHLGLKRAIKHT